MMMAHAHGTPKQKAAVAKLMKKGESHASASKKVYKAKSSKAKGY